MPTARMPLRIARTSYDIGSVVVKKLTRFRPARCLGLHGARAALVGRPQVSSGGRRTILRAIPRAGGAPTSPRRSRNSTPWWWRAPPSPGRPCTTSRRLRRKDVREGDTIVVHKAGDVIPEVVGPVTEGDLAVEHEARPLTWQMPERCPACRSPVMREEGEVAYRCLSLDCPAQATERLIHWGDRAAMDIDGFGRRARGPDGRAEPAR